MKLFKQLGLAAFLTTAAFTNSFAADYVIDTEGAHASINFEIPHLGYSMLLGRFNHFSGEFSYDEKAPEKASIEVEIDTTSLDSNHAERDKHLKAKDFLYVSKYPKSTFISKSFEPSENGGVLKGDLTLKGVTKPIEIAVTNIGAGDDPWGGYRRGFSGETQLTLKDFNIDVDLGAASRAVTLKLHVEGIRK
ncbi:YceI family protein [Candidatus Albibeggiatoa sp. nov. NOAA]|uniref:YceI family protein n=1 Tax=Candidatus Albibeggiatoa sp. nov. NOAA TaxID=3162724 RepID=UPI0032FC684D|nr:YceI family protein [Thiotrichaceae bacterium]